MRTEASEANPKEISPGERDGILCPHCGGRKFKVLHTDGSWGRLFRRRLCLDCDKRFTTVEQ